jgi:hypothetical protein
MASPSTGWRKSVTSSTASKQGNTLSGAFMYKTKACSATSAKSALALLFPALTVGARR